jgi:hypothetical protein
MFRPRILLTKFERIDASTHMFRIDFLNDFAEASKDMERFPFGIW